MKTRIIILLTFAVVLLNITAITQTYVSGPITEETTWFKSNNPYIVTGDVTLLAILTIEPGVEVRFEEGFQLRVSAAGILNAQGTINDTITFTSNKDSPEPGDWNRMFIENVPYSTDINYVKIEYANTGFYVENALFNIINSSISHCVDGVFVDGVDSYGTIDECTISHNNKGVFGSWAAWYPSIKVKNSNISYNNEAGIYCTSTMFKIYLCNISHNKLYGIYCDHTSTISDNIFEYNGIALRTQDRTIKIYDNIIQNDSIGILVGDNPTKTIINCNSFYSNTTYNLVYVGGYEDGEVDARFNYFGTTSIEEIEESIYDIFDDIMLGGYFNFQPFNTTDSLECYNTGINHFESKKTFAIYPNPSKDIINISFGHNLNTILEVKIINIYGQVMAIKKVQSDNAVIDVSFLPSGIYFVDTKYKNKVMLNKFIIQN